MDLEDELVTHGKVNILDFTLVEIDSSKGDIIDFGTIEIAVVKGAIDKRNPHKSTSREITMLKNATFKISVVDGVLGVGNLGVGLL